MKKALHSETILFLIGVIKHVIEFQVNRIVSPIWYPHTEAEQRADPHRSLSWSRSKSINDFTLTFRLISLSLNPIGRLASRNALHFVWLFNSTTMRNNERVDASRKIEINWLISQHPHSVNSTLASLLSSRQSCVFNWFRKLADARKIEINCQKKEKSKNNHLPFVSFDAQTQSLITDLNRSPRSSENDANENSSKLHEKKIDENIWWN